MPKVRSKYLATTTLIDGEPYLEPFAATGDASITSISLNNTGLKVKDTGGDHTLTIAPSENLSANRTLSLSVNNADRTLTMNASTTLAGGTQSGTNTGDQTSIVGITGTKAQFDSALDDGAFAFTTACPSITFADAANIAVDTTTGTQIGTNASQKLGFFGVTPVTQRANIVRITDSTGGSESDTFSATGDAVTNDNFATTATRLNAIEQLLQDLGLTD